MSAKARFLNKLQGQKARDADNRAEADIAAFRQRAGKLQETMETWLAGTDIRITAFNTSLVEFLTGGGTFSVPGIELRYQQRCIRFTPIFLYGQGVAGCTEVSLSIAGEIKPLYRLFMRCGHQDAWSWLPADQLSRQSNLFDEDAFFTMIEPLLPE